MKDKIVERILQQETKRQNDTLNLIPSENFVSEDVLAALGSTFTNKYAEGYSTMRYYGGNEYVDKIETLCRRRALRLFKLQPEEWRVNVQPYSGSPANLAVYVALVPLGGKIMGLQLDMGGHLTHGHKVSFTSKAWQSAPYTLNKATEELDYNDIRELAIKERPNLIIAGYTAYPRIIDFKRFREIADGAGAYFMVDMSHFAGLVAGEAYPSPFPYADVVTTTAHKTLRGPRAAMIFSRRTSKFAAEKGVDIPKKVDRAVFPGLQGGPHVNQIAATAVALSEAAQPRFRKYATQIVKNAKTLAEALKKEGWRLVSGGTDTHLLLVDVAAKGIRGKEASDRLEANGIIVNKNTIPYDSNPPMNPSGIRMGTPALTTRGMKEREMKLIGQLISDVLLRGKKVKATVKLLCRRFPLKY